MMRSWVLAITLILASPALAAELPVRIGQCSTTTVKQVETRLVDGATNQPMPPDGQYHYSFSSFWAWVENNYSSYTQFRAVPNAQYVAEMWFDREMKQAWRN